MATLHTTLTITGLQTYGYHGMFDAERELGQKFIFDVSATMAPTQTHLPDKLDASVRYDEIVQDIVRISDDSTFRTLEALAEQSRAGYLSVTPSYSASRSQSQKPVHPFSTWLNRFASR